MAAIRYYGVMSTVAHALFVSLFVGVTVLSTVLAVVNVRHGREAIARNADWLAETLGVDDPQEIVDYQRLTTGLSLLQTWVLLAGALVVLYGGHFGTVVDTLVASGLDPILQGVVLFVGATLLYQLATVPFDLFSTFVVDELFDLNETTPRLWLRDTLLQVVLTVVVTGLVVGVLLAFVEPLPTAWWAVAGWAVVVGFSLVLQVVYPRVIAPLFNDFEPITDPDLTAAIEDLFDRVGARTSGIYTMDASRRSSRLNAYFVGFGSSKRVVLFDTLLEKLERPQILSVLAHELAHWQYGHIWKRIAASAVQTGVVFAALAVLVSADIGTVLFGLPTETVAPHLFVALLVVYPLLELSAPLVNRLSLAHEREADRFAVEATDGAAMVAALSTLARENLANPFPHPWYAAFAYSHPPIAERIRLIRSYGEE